MTLRSEELSSKILPPPIGGWNLRDPLHAMPDTDAPQLDNWFPGNSRVELRGGSSLFATLTGEVGVVTMLQSVPGSNGVTDNLLASGQNTNDVFEISSAGVVTAVDTTLSNPEPYFGLTHNGDIYYKSYDDAVGFPYKIYDPVTSTVSNANITNGLNYFGLGSYKGALYFPNFITPPFPSFGYGPVDAVNTFTALNFDLTRISKEGGRVVFCGSTTRTKSFREDCLFCAVTVRGEVFVYEGAHPSETTWGLVGIYKIPRPFGHKSFFYLGGNLHIWTVAGIISIASIINDQQIAGRYNSISDKIDPHWKTLATPGNLSLDQPGLHVGSNRFACCVDSTKSILYLIAPDDYVYGMNLLTGAWCRVSGWPAYSIAYANDEVYIGSTNGAIIKINDPDATGDYNPATGATDSIATETRLAPNYLDTPTRKSVVSVDVLADFTDGFSMTIDADVDYDNNVPVSTTVESLGSGEKHYKTNCGLVGSGDAISLHQKDSYASAKDVKINAFKVYYKEGDITP